VSAEAGKRWITEITHIENYTNQRIWADNHEEGQFFYIPAATSASRPGSVNVNWRVPWCTSADDYWWNHYIDIGLSGVHHRFSIWQRSVSGVDRIRWTNERRWDPAALPMPGDSYVDGTRVLKIYKLDGEATPDNDERAELVD
jgi:hypothetical protein